MPRRKKTKAVKENFVPKRNYEFLTADEIKERQQQHENHVKNLKGSLNYIRESDSVVAKLEADGYNLKKWQEYVNCYALPKAYLPPHIRLLLEKLKHFEKLSSKENISWRLFVDERSILTQNVFREDLTSATLKQKLKINFGPVYDRGIDTCLGMLKRIEEFMENHLEVGKCDEHILNDIKELRKILQQQIAEFLNQFTYQILSSGETYMNSIDALSSEYKFLSNNFQMHIWILKNVPIRFPRLDLAHFIVNLYGINVTLSIPTSIMKENFAIRALHMEFDHLSETDHLLLNEIMVPLQARSFLLQDLVECLNNEWLMETEILNRVRNELIIKRQEYEEEIKVFEEQKAKKKDKLKIKAPKHEPQLIDDDMFPNVREEFLEEEQKQYNSYFNNLHSSLTMNLEADEINLQQYFILGGIYQLYQVEKPQNTEFNASSLNMTWHLNNSNLVIVEDLVITSETKSYRRMSKIYKIDPRKTLSNAVSQLNEYTESQCPWFILSIQLPENLCYWGQPVACQYETVTKVKSNPEILPDNIELAPKTSKPASLSKRKKVPVFIPEKVHSNKPSQESMTKCLYNIQVATKNTPIHDGATNAEGILNVSDFPLKSLLSKPQIRHIQRHVLPRMISSLKFNKEIREDASTASQKKRKFKKGGILIRHHAEVNNEPNSETEALFEFGPMQNNPERLIPIYAQDEPIRVLQQTSDKTESNIEHQGLKSFAQLVKLINFIKCWHKLQERKITDLKPFESRVPVVNQLLKTVKKENLKSQPSKSSVHLTYSKINIESQISKTSLTSKMSVVEPSESNISSTFMNDSISAKESTLKTYSDVSDLEEEEDHPTYSCSHWTTKHITKSEFNRETHTVVVQTDRLGHFGFAFKQYEHFPFKSWTLEPNPKDPENEIIFTIETPHVRCILLINENGLKCRITEHLTEKYVSKPKIYLVIDEPISNLNKLKTMLQEKNLNIFAGEYARFYIENGYFSEKHLSTELHTYNCMAMNCTEMKFSSSQWNCLAQRRDIILKFLHHQHSEENTVEIRITPEEAFFVEITEQCSDDLDVIQLAFNLTWRNISFFSDLNHLVNSMYPTAHEVKCKNAKLLNFVKNILYEIRPLSFS